MYYTCIFTCVAASMVRTGSPSMASMEAGWKLETNLADLA